jgi:hypothetical protein
VLPVLVYRDVQVETVVVDLGDGVRQWIEVRDGDRVEYCASLAELPHVLHRRGLRYADLAPVDTIDDGCE